MRREAVPTNLLTDYCKIDLEFGPLVRPISEGGTRMRVSELRMRCQELMMRSQDPRKERYL